MNRNYGQIAHECEMFLSTYNDPHAEPSVIGHRLYELRKRVGMEGDDERRNPNIRVAGRVGHRTVTVNGYNLPSVTEVTTEEGVKSGGQEITVTMLTDRLSVGEQRGSH